MNTPHLTPMIPKPLSSSSRGSTPIPLNTQSTSSSNSSGYVNAHRHHTHAAALEPMNSGGIDGEGVGGDSNSANSHNLHEHMRDQTTVPPIPQKGSSFKQHLPQIGEALNGQGADRGGGDRGGGGGHREDREGGGGGQGDIQGEVQGTFQDPFGDGLVGSEGFQQSPFFVKDIPPFATATAGGTEFGTD